MSESLTELLNNNARWAESLKQEDPDFFQNLARQQSPKYLWIGCSDSRVPANQIVGLMPGEIFVHRNLANLVLHNDLNCMSVIQFAVDVLKIQHIIVCGHYGCSGINAAMTNQKVGLADNWLRVIRKEYERNSKIFTDIPENERWNALCELNVMEQVRSVASSTILQDAWARGQKIDINGWVYDIHDGRIRELVVGIDSPHAFDRYADAIKAMQG
jgi:carbonic anhydrase